jgi:hypothetical protein
MTRPASTRAAPEAAAAPIAASAHRKPPSETLTTTGRRVSVGRVGDGWPDDEAVKHNADAATRAVIRTFTAPSVRIADKALRNSG